MRRYFLNSSALNDNTITITGEEHTHLAYVLRTKVGEQIIICFNDGFDYLCTITDISKSQTTCKVQDVKQSTTETIKNVVLFQSLIKADNLELIIQKSTELGIKEIQPFTSEFCQIAINKFKPERCLKIATNAAKQCERSIIPTIHNAIKFEEMLNQLKQFDAVIFANERQGENNIVKELSKKNVNKVAVVIGCEGGFSESEKQQLLQLNNIISITLGKRILKAETASIVALALTMNALGEI